MGKGEKDAVKEAATVEQIVGRRGIRDYLRPEHANTAFLVFTAVFGSVMYFAGAQYHDAKAKAFGFAADVGDLPFQRQVASGVMVFVNPYVIGLLLVFIALGFSLFSFSNWLLLSNASPLNVKKLVKNALEHKDEVENIRSRYEEISSLPEAEVDVSEIETLKRNLRKLEWKTNLTVLRAHVAIAVKPLVQQGLIFCGVGVTFIIILAGRAVGGVEAEQTLANVRGSCEGCLTFKARDRNAKGLAVLQSDKLLIVSTKQGAVAFLLEEPLEVVQPEPEKTKANGGKNKVTDPVTKPNPQRSPA